MSIAAPVRRFVFVAWVLGVAVALGLVGNVLPANAAGDDPVQALIKCDEDWSKSAATRDAERVAAFYAPDAVAYPPNEPVAVGQAAAKKVWAGYFADPSFSISWKTVHAGVATSGELGYTSGTYEARFKDADGKLVTEKGKFLCNWRKEKDGNWKAIHDMWNSDAK